MMRAAKSSRAWIGALALVVAMAYSSDRAHVVHAVRFADKAKVFGLASGSGYLQGNGSGGVTESALTPGQLPGATGSDGDAFVTTGVLDTQTTLGDSVAFGLGSSAAAEGLALGKDAVAATVGVALGKGAVATAGAGALGELAKGRVAGTLRSTLPLVVARGGAGETGSGSASAGLGAFRAFASGQVVLATPPIAIKDATGGTLPQTAEIIIPAGAMFIPQQALVWLCEFVPGSNSVTALTWGSGDAAVNFGKTAVSAENLQGSTDYGSVPLDGGSWTLGKARAAPATVASNFNSICTGTIYVKVYGGPSGTFDDSLRVSVRGALVGILVEREESDA